MASCSGRRTLTWPVISRARSRRARMRQACATFAVRSGRSLALFDAIVAVLSERERIVPACRRICGSMMPQIEGAAGHPARGGRQIVGGFFTNVQVHTGDRSPAEVREEIVGALRRWIASEGFVEDSGLADDDADRVILVAPAGPEPWIAVYDAATEDQDTDKLRALAELLSQHARAAVS